MPIDDEVRALLRNAETEQRGAGIDIGAVIRRTRRRRLPMQAAAAAAVLAVVGLGAVGIEGIRVLGGTSGASDSASAPEAPTTAEESGGDQSGGAPATGDAEGLPGAESGAGGIRTAPLDRLNLCEGTVADVAPSDRGLETRVEFPDAVAAGSGSVSGTVQLVNSGAQRVIGVVTAGPVVTVARGDLVVWHTSSSTAGTALPVDLEPGETMLLTASFDPVACSVEDDLAGEFPDDLPDLEPGGYAVSAAVAFAPDLQSLGGGETPAGAAETVTGEASTVTVQ